jgi:quercetin dioxygenase-like cupin family protein
MITLVDLNAELAKLTTLQGRTPATPPAEREAAFTTLGAYRDGAMFAGKFSGTSAWERHPQGDEIVQIVQGKATLHVITEAGRQSYTLSPGMLAVVPRNAWHQFEAPEGVALMTATPQPTQHLTVDVDDPRTLEHAAV